MFTGAIDRVKECLVGLTWDLLEMLAYPIIQYTYPIIHSVVFENGPEKIAH